MLYKQTQSSSSFYCVPLLKKDVATNGFWSWNFSEQLFNKTTLNQNKFYFLDLILNSVVKIINLSRQTRAYATTIPYFYCWEVSTKKKCVFSTATPKNYRLSDWGNYGSCSSRELGWWFVMHIGWRGLLCFWITQLLNKFFLDEKVAHCLNNQVLNSACTSVGPNIVDTKVGLK